jgi:hypothetical protein
MIDHAVVKTTSAVFGKTVQFYKLALAPLGYKQLRDIPDQASGFGDTTPDFWIMANGKDGESSHVALRAKGVFSSVPAKQSC